MRRNKNMPTTPPTTNYTAYNSRPHPKFHLHWTTTKNKEEYAKSSEFCINSVRICK